MEHIEAELPHIADSPWHEARCLLSLKVSLVELDKYLVSWHTVSLANLLVNNGELDALDVDFEDSDTLMSGDMEHARNSADVDGANRAGLRRFCETHDGVAVVEVALRKLDNRGPVAHAETVPVEDEARRGWALAEEINRSRCRVLSVVHRAKLAHHLLVPFDITSHTDRVHNRAAPGGGRYAQGPAAVCVAKKTLLRALEPTARRQHRRRAGVRMYGGIWLPRGYFAVRGEEQRVQRVVEQIWQHEDEDGTREEEEPAREAARPGRHDGVCL